jgi:hypothetical protein
VVIGHKDKLNINVMCADDLKRYWDVIAIETIRARLILPFVACVEGAHNSAKDATCITVHYARVIPLASGRITLASHRITLASRTLAPCSITLNIGIAHDTAAQCTCIVVATTAVLRVIIVL